MTGPEVPGWGSSEAALGARTPAAMRGLSPASAVHPAGVGSAAEFMTRLLLREVPADWVCLVDDRRWRASSAAGAVSGVMVRAEPGMDVWWVHGWRPPLYRNTAEAGVMVELPRCGFTALAADAVVGLLRGMSVL